MPGSRSTGQHQRSSRRGQTGPVRHSPSTYPGSQASQARPSTLLLYCPLHTAPQSTSSSSPPTRVSHHSPVSTPSHCPVAHYCLTQTTPLPRLCFLDLFPSIPQEQTERLSPEASSRSLANFFPLGSETTATPLHPLILILSSRKDDYPATAP